MFTSCSTSTKMSTSHFNFPSMTNCWTLVLPECAIPFMDGSLAHGTQIKKVHILSLILWNWFKSKLFKTYRAQSLFSSCSSKSNCASHRSWVNDTFHKSMLNIRRQHFESLFSVWAIFEFTIYISKSLTLYHNICTI